MREASLPSPNIGPCGFHLRRVAAKAISQLEVVAPRYAGGKHPSATELKAFFDACSAACAAIAPAEAE